MQKIRLDVESLSVTTFQTTAGSLVIAPASMETQDRSCFEYCGPDDNDTGPTTSGMPWC